MAKDVPREFHEPWARAFSEVLGHAELASTADDTVALERAFKWVLVTHQLLLRLGIGRRAAAVSLTPCGCALSSLRTARCAPSSHYGALTWPRP
jgi:hypothetical protein